MKPRTHGLNEVEYKAWQQVMVDMICVAQALAQEGTKEEMILNSAERMEAIWDRCQGNRSDSATMTISDCRAVFAAVCREAIDIIEGDRHE